MEARSHVKVRQGEAARECRCPPEKESDQGRAQRNPSEGELDRTGGDPPDEVERAGGELGDCGVDKSSSPYEARRPENANRSQQKDHSAMPTTIEVENSKRVGDGRRDDREPAGGGSTGDGPLRGERRARVSRGTHIQERKCFEQCQEKQAIAHEQHAQLTGMYDLSRVGEASRADGQLEEADERDVKPRANSAPPG